MATKIQVGADASQAKSALGQVNDELKKTAAAAEAAGDKLDEAASMGEFGKATVSAEQLREKLVEVEKQARQATDAAKQPGSSDSLAKWTALFTGITAGVEITKKISEGFVIAREKIKELADGGNADMARLDASLNQVSSSVDNFTQRLLNSRAGQETASFFSNWADQIAGGFEALPELLPSIETFFASTVISMREAIGVSADDYRQYLNEIAEANRTADEQFRQQLENQKIALQKSKAEALVGDLKSQRDKDRQSQLIAEQTSLEEINKALGRQLTRAKELAAQGKFDARQERESRELINKLEERRKQLVKDAHDAEKRRAADSAKAAADQAKAAKDKAQADAEAHTERVRQAMSPAPVHSQGTPYPSPSAGLNQQSAQAAIQKQMQAAFETQVQKAGPATEDAASKIVAASEETRAVAAQLAKQAAEVDRRKFEKDHADEYAAARKVIRDTTGVVGPSRERSEAMEQIRRLDYQADSVATRSQRAHFNAAQRQLKGQGPQVFGEDQILGAIEQNTKETVADVAASGQLSKSMVASLEKQTQAIVQSRQDTLQLQQQVDAMSQALDHVQQSQHTASNNGRRRAQMRGNSLW